MAYYLQMNGGTNNVKLPSITFNKVILDIKVQRRTDATRNYFDFRTGFSFAYLQSTTGGVDSEGNDSPMSTYIDGAGPKTNNTVMVPNDVRCLLETRWATASTDDGNIFSNSSGSGGQIGNIYDVKFYNGATLVAHYDMTTQTVQDQSGNGNHATLTGGTWVNDSAGTAYTASLSDAISTSDTIRKSLSVAVVDVVNASEVESERTTKSLTDNVGTSESITSSRGKVLNVSDTIAITDSIRKALTLAKSDAVIAGETESEAIRRQLADAFTQTDTIIVSGGKAVLLAESFAMTDTTRNTLSRAVAESLGVADNITRRNASVRLYDVVLTTETFTKQLPNASVYVQEIPFNVYVQRVLTYETDITRSSNFGANITRSKNFDTRM